VAVVHNGIIENFRSLREELEGKRYSFVTDTDTEVVAFLCQSYLDAGATPADAVRDTLKRLDGAFALAFLFEGEDDLMIAARKGSPLAIGHGDGEMFIGSDAIALAPMTDRITYLEEGDRAVVTRAGAEIFDEADRRVNRDMKRVRLDTARVEKAGHKHFMSKEIAEQPVVLAEAIQAYTAGNGLNFPAEVPDFADVKRVTMVACGTAYFACFVAKYWIERLARIPVEIDVASEYRYREPPVEDGTLAIFVSQSGETADTLAALRYVKDKARILSVVNAMESSIARESDVALSIHAGTEIGVASTKAFTCQLVVLLALALKAAADKGEMDAETLAARIDELRSLPGLVARALDASDRIERVSHALAEYEDILFLGRGQMYPLAHEGALKLKEISYIHAEAYASGELKHGPIALIDRTCPVVVLAPRDPLFEKTVSNMQEVMARDGLVLLISDRAGIEEAAAGTWNRVEMPTAPDLLNPILYAIPAQLLAYHTAVAKGTDVDQPRNLAKSVTVE
jgi:glucosamine--fructose-6-phosphate aminotransferase (isomerizing)